MGRRVISFDTETEAFRPGLMAPPVICMSYQEHGQEAKLVSIHEAKPIVEDWFNSDVVLVGHTTEYDVCCLMEEFNDHIPLWFEKYERNEITDVSIRQELIDIARGEHLDPGEYGLATLYQRHTGRVLPKPALRQEFGALRDVPISEWPSGFAEYALGDAVATLDVACYQAANRELLDDQYNQAYAYLGLRLCSIWGLRTSAEGVAELERRTQTRRREAEEVLRIAGIIRQNGKKSMANLRGFVEQAKDHLELTKKGAISTSIHVLKEIDHPIAHAMIEWSKLGSVINREIPLLKRGVSEPVHTRFGMAGTGRTTSRPNFQNFGKDTGARECLMPRPGHIFIQADFDQFELRGHAQVNLVWLGESRMAELLASGVCPHLWYASIVHEWNHEDAILRYKQGDPEIAAGRQEAKAYLFGLPGGMGVERFCITYKRATGKELDPRTAQSRKDLWLRSFPEMPKYFRHVRKFEQFDGSFIIKHLYSNRIRTVDKFAEACNTPFQGICGDASKSAICQIQKASYAEKASPLYGARLVNWVHDEAWAEVPDDEFAHDKAMELGRLMVLGAKKFIPDVEVKTTPLLTHRLKKGLKPKYLNGRLISSCT